MKKRVFGVLITFIMALGMLTHSLFALALNVSTDTPDYTGTLDLKYPVVSFYKDEYKNILDKDHPLMAADFKDNKISLSATVSFDTGNFDAVAEVLNNAQVAPYPISEDTLVAMGINQSTRDSFCSQSEAGARTCMVSPSWIIWMNKDRLTLEASYSVTITLPLGFSYKDSFIKAVTSSNGTSLFANNKLPSGLKVKELSFAGGALHISFYTATPLEGKVFFNSLKAIDLKLTDAIVVDKTVIYSDSYKIYEKQGKVPVDVLVTAKYDIFMPVAMDDPDKPIVPEEEPEESAGESKFLQSSEILANYNAAKANIITVLDLFLSLDVIYQSDNPADADKANTYFGGSVTIKYVDEKGKNFKKNAVLTGLLGTEVLLPEVSGYDFYKITEEKKFAPAGFAKQTATGMTYKTSSQTFIASYAKISSTVSTDFGPKLVVGTAKKGELCPWILALAGCFCILVHHRYRILAILDKK
ncbi:MAG: hypothetical protein LBR25_09945 [Erysipelotrichaceae bacterium]|jgi:hypothetical protein|nr:hypothetical protein [Erysipelotrichaceae bacterium]